MHTQHIKPEHRQDDSPDAVVYSLCNRWYGILYLHGEPPEFLQSETKAGIYAQIRARERRGDVFDVREVGRFSNEMRRANKSLFNRVMRRHGVEVA